MSNQRCEAFGVGGIPRSFVNFARVRTEEWLMDRWPGRIIHAGCEFLWHHLIREMRRDLLEFLQKLRVTAAGKVRFSVAVTGSET
jgi:hypothetical protein